MRHARSQLAETADQVYHPHTVYKCVFYSSGLLLFVICLVASASMLICPWLMSIIDS